MLWYKLDKSEREREEEGGGGLYLGLDSSQVSFDGLGLGYEDGILFLVASDAGLQVSDHLLHRFCLCLVVGGVILELLQFIAQRLHALQHVGIIELVGRHNMVYV